MLLYVVALISQIAEVKAYDGASNMSGHLSGVATRIQKEQPKAHYVHCVAHCLNLCLQDLGKKCACIRNALGIATELSNLIRASPKSLALFRQLYGLKLAYLIFGASEQLSSTLQYKDINNAQEASTAVSIALAFLQRQRCDFAFESFYNSTVMNSRSYTQEPDLPRQKKIPKGFLMVLQFNSVPL